MSSRTRTRPKLVYFQHLQNGAVHGYDEAFLAAAFASLDLPKDQKALQTKKHPLEEIAIQIRSRVLIPCQAPASVQGVEVPDDVVQQVLSKERELGRERKRAQLEDILARMDAGEDVHIPEHLLQESDYVPAVAAAVVPDAPAPRGPGGITDGEAAPAPMAGAPGADLPFSDELSAQPGPQDAKPRRRVRTPAAGAE